MDYVYDVSILVLSYRPALQKLLTSLKAAIQQVGVRFEVIVSDDGNGFDTTEVKNDGRSHIGMDNVRRRIKEMCGGSVRIESKIGEGTVATVVLPKEGQKNEDSVC